MGEAGSASKAEVIDFYDGFVSRQARVGVNRRHHAILDWLRRFGLGPADSVLEVGCGIGTLTELLAEALPEGSVLGVDVSPKSIEIARERLARFDNATLAAGDVLEVEVAGRYEVVVLPDVIEHVPLEAHGELFARVASWVKDDGFVLLHYPNPHHLEWCQANHPDRLQIVDQPIHADLLMANAYRSGLYLAYYERYSIWLREGDYIVAVLRLSSGVGEFTRLPQPKPSIASRLAGRASRLGRRLAGAERASS
jgi:trans-aconitate 2-methyltransferase